MVSFSSIYFSSFDCFKCEIVFTNGTSVLFLSGIHHFSFAYIGLVDKSSFFLFPSYPLNDAAETVNEIGASIRRVMGGTSGIMYISFFFSVLIML